MCSENKGADQLRGYRDADLRLCFRIVTGKLICVFVFAYAKSRFSQDAAGIISLLSIQEIIGI